MTGEDYTIAGEIETNEIFIKEDGYKYTPTEYWNVLSKASDPHSPDFMDYSNFITKFDLVSLKNKYVFDEVHFYSIPYAGAFESRVVGRNAIYCNSAPFYANCDNFCIMGFSFERGVTEAIEAYMHRTEFIIAYEHPSFWDGFRKEVGTVHLPHNGECDYDWANPKYKLCYADRYILNPFEFIPVERSCAYWGCNGLGYFEYWFSHIPESMRNIILHVDKIKG
jgi:hypothetical protein